MRCFCRQGGAGLTESRTPGPGEAFMSTTKQTFETASKSKNAPDDTISAAMSKVKYLRWMQAKLGMKRSGGGKRSGSFSPAHQATA
eukprot:2566215-Rhodomonas_salina.2